MELTREEETLALKMCVHDRFGRCLTATEQLLLERQPLDDAVPILEEWRQAIALIEQSGGEAEEYDLLDIMDRTMQGESIYPDRTPEVKLGMTTNYSLTENELEVLRVVMETETYNEAAKKLFCSEANVRYHMGNILNKTGYPNKFKLCMAVAKKNLIITDSDKDFW